MTTRLLLAALRETLFPLAWLHPAPPTHTIDVFDLAKELSYAGNLLASPRLPSALAR